MNFGDQVAAIAAARRKRDGGTNSSNSDVNKSRASMTRANQSLSRLSKGSSHKKKRNDIVTLPPERKQEITATLASLFAGRMKQIQANDIQSDQEDLVAIANYRTNPSKAQTNQQRFKKARDDIVPLPPEKMSEIKGSLSNFLSSRLSQNLGSKEHERLPQPAAVTTDQKKKQKLPPDDFVRLTPEKKSLASAALSSLLVSRSPPAEKAPERRPLPVNVPTNSQKDRKGARNDVVSISSEKKKQASLALSSLLVSRSPQERKSPEKAPLAVSVTTPQNGRKGTSNDMVSLSRDKKSQASANLSSMLLSRSPKEQKSPERAPLAVRETTPQNERKGASDDMVSLSRDKKSQASAALSSMLLSRSPKEQKSPERAPQAVSVTTPQNERKGAPNDMVSLSRDKKSQASAALSSLLVSRSPLDQSRMSSAMSSNDSSPGSETVRRANTSSKIVPSRKEPTYGQRQSQESSVAVPNSPATKITTALPARNPSLKDPAIAAQVLGNNLNENNLQSTSESTTEDLGDGDHVASSANQGSSQNVPPRIRRRAMSRRGSLPKMGYGGVGTSSAVDNVRDGAQPEPIVSAPTQTSPGEDEGGKGHSSLASEQGSQHRDQQQPKQSQRRSPSPFSRLRMSKQQAAPSRPAPVAPDSAIPGEPPEEQNPSIQTGSSTQLEQRWGSPLKFGLMRSNSKKTMDSGKSLALGRLSSGRGSKLSEPTVDDCNVAGNKPVPTRDAQGLETDGTSHKQMARRGFLSRSITPQPSAAHDGRDKKNLFRRSATPQPMARTAGRVDPTMNGTQTVASSKNVREQKGASNRAWLGSFHGKAVMGKPDPLVVLSPQAGADKIQQNSSGVSHGSEVSQKENSIDSAPPGVAASSQDTNLGKQVQSLSEIPQTVFVTNSVHQALPYVQSHQSESSEIKSHQERTPEESIKSQMEEESRRLRMELEAAKKASVQLEGMNAKQHKTLKRLLSDLQGAKRELQKLKEAQMNGESSNQSQNLAGELESTTAELLALRKEHQAVLDSNRLYRQNSERDKQKRQGGVSFESHAAPGTQSDRPKDMAEAMATIARLEAENKKLRMKLGNMETTEQRLVRAQAERGQEQLRNGSNASQTPGKAVLRPTQSEKINRSEKPKALANRKEKFQAELLSL